MHRKFQKRRAQILPDLKVWVSLRETDEEDLKAGQIIVRRADGRFRIMRISNHNLGSSVEFVEIKNLADTAGWTFTYNKQYIMAMYRLPTEEELKEIKLLNLIR